MRQAQWKNLVGLAVLGMTLVTTAIPTWAGYRFPQEVLIDVTTEPNHPYASGSMVGARYSTDSNQNIGCTAFVRPTYTWTSCFAVNRAGAALVCGSGNPQWAEAVKSMTSSSYMRFELDSPTNGGDCRDIQVTTGSEMLK